MCERSSPPTVLLTPPAWPAPRTPSGGTEARVQPDRSSAQDSPLEARLAGRARQVGRREVLRLLGFTAVAVTPIPLVGTGLDALVGGSAPIGEDPHHPAAEVNGRLRRWAMVIDLRRCDGCQGVNLPPQCTQACIEGHFVPRPMQWIQVFEEPRPPANAIEEGSFFTPVPCQQCQNPPCTNVCPVGAAFLTPEGPLLRQPLCARGAAGRRRGNDVHRCRPRGRHRARQLKGVRVSRC